MMKYDLIVENVTIANLLEFVVRTNIGLKIQDDVFVIFNHKFMIFEITNELLYDFNYFKNNNIPFEDYFFSNRYNLNSMYIDVSIENLGILDEQLSIGVATLFGKQLASEFGTSVFLSDDESSKIINEF